MWRRTKTRGPAVARRLCERRAVDPDVARRMTSLVSHRVDRREAGCFERRVHAEDQPDRDRRTHADDEGLPGELRVHRGQGAPADEGTVMSGLREYSRTGSRHESSGG